MNLNACASTDHDAELVLMNTLICLSLSSDGTSATFFPRPLSIERTQWMISGVLF